MSSLTSREIVTQRFARLLEPVRYFWAVVYLFVFAYYVTKANLDVAYFERDGVLSGQVTPVDTEFGRLDGLH